MSFKQKITPFLWFDENAEEAANYYVSIFDNSKILHVARYGDSGPGPRGSVMIVTFQLEGQQFTALNGGPQHKFNEAISLMVTCDSQKEVDRFWNRLTDGGQEVACGWLKDRFGLSWQIVPSAFFEMMQDKDTEKTDRVMKAMMQMTKMDVAKLEAAYRGK